MLYHYTINGLALKIVEYNYLLNKFAHKTFQEELDENSLSQSYAERQTDFLPDGPHKVRMPQNHRIQHMKLNLTMID